jgi:hypothetical protein
MYAFIIQSIDELINNNNNNNNNNISLILFYYSCSEFQKKQQSSEIKKDFISEISNSLENINKSNIINSSFQSWNNEGIFKIIPEFCKMNEILLFNLPKIIIWKRISNICYSFVCEEDENRYLASHYLNWIIKTIDEHFKKNGISTHPEEYLQKNEELLMLIHTLIPNGQLLFSTTHFLKFLKKEIENNLK